MQLNIYNNWYDIFLKVGLGAQMALMERLCLLFPC